MAVNVIREGGMPGGLKKLVNSGNKKAPAHGMAKGKAAPVGETPAGQQAASFMQTLLAQKMGRAGAKQMGSDL